MNTYLTSFEQLPLVLSVADVAGVMGVSKPIAYDMVHRSGFPSIRVSDKRIVIPRDSFRDWMNKQASSSDVV